MKPCKICPICEAKFVKDDHGNLKVLWSTGKLGEPNELAGLVCNNPRVSAAVRKRLGPNALDNCANLETVSGMGDQVDLWADREDFKVSF